MIIDPIPLPQAGYGAQPSSQLPVAARCASGSTKKSTKEWAPVAIDLEKHLVKSPSASYCAWAKGDSLVEMGIFDGDLLIVDRSLQAGHGDLVVVSFNDELYCRVLDLNQGVLMAANGAYAPITMTKDLAGGVDGVVVHSVRHLRYRG